MKTKVIPMILTCALALSACGGGSSNNNNNGMMNAGGGGTGGGGTGGAGGGGAGGGGTGGGGAGGGAAGGNSDVIALRGMATRTAKRESQRINLGPAGTRILYEIGEPFAVTGTATSQTSNAGIDAELDLSNAGFNGVAGTGTAKLTTTGNFANGTAVPDETGDGGSFLGDPQFLVAPGSTSNLGDYFLVQRTDVDSDGEDDFFTVDQQDGGADPNRQFQTVGIYYGGDFAPVSALTGKTRAVYSRTDGALVRIITGNNAATAGSNSSTYDGDVRMVADFNAGRVDGRITLSGGADPAPGDILLSNARINGTDYTGGTVRVVNAGTSTNAAGSNLTSSGFIGSFMGANADRTAGVFQATGTMRNIDRSNNTNANALISGRFEADEE